MTKTKIANIPYGPYVTVLAGASVKGKPNYATIGAYGVVSQKPVLYISLKNTHYTTAGVIENGYFSVNIPSSDDIEKKRIIAGLQRAIKQINQTYSSLFTIMQVMHP